MNAAQHPSRESCNLRINALCQQSLIPRQKSIRQCPAGRFNTSPSTSELLRGAILCFTALGMLSFVKEEYSLTSILSTTSQVFSDRS